MQIFIYKANMNFSANEFVHSEFDGSVLRTYLNGKLTDSRAAKIGDSFFILPCGQKNAPKVTAVELPKTKGAKIAVDAAGKSMKRVWTVLYVPCPYTFYERVKLEVAAFGGIIRTTDFGAEVELELLFPENQAQSFLDRLTDMTSGTVEGMETGKEYRAFPIDT